MKYKLSLILTAVALTLSLPGCGTSKNKPMDFLSEGTASSSSQTTTPTQIPEENPEKADDLFEQSQSSGTVRDLFSGGGIVYFPLHSNTSFAPVFSCMEALVSCAVCKIIDAQSMDISNTRKHKKSKILLLFLHLTY